MYIYIIYIYIYIYMYIYIYAKINKNRIPCLISHNRKLTMIRKILSKYWNVVQENAELRQIFQNNTFVAFKSHKNLEEIIAGRTIKNRKVFKTHLDKNGRKEPII